MQREVSVQLLPVRIKLVFERDIPLRELREVWRGEGGIDRAFGHACEAGGGGHGELGGED